MSWVKVFWKQREKWNLAYTPLTTHFVFFFCSAYDNPPKSRSITCIFYNSMGVKLCYFKDNKVSARENQTSLHQSPTHFAKEVNPFWKKYTDFFNEFWKPWNRPE